jgi:hypothetical protein
VQGNILVLGALLALLDVGFHILGWATGPRVHKTFTSLNGGSKSPVVDDPDLGYKPAPSKRVHIVKTIDDRPCYEASYSFDALSRRRVPLRVSPDTNRFLIFFGGSRTFGPGVEDDETLPYFAASAFGSHSPYSYSYSAWGPPQILSLLRTRPLEREVLQRSGIAVFFLIEGHISRTIGSVRVTTEYHRNYPYFALTPDTKKLIRRGNFLRGRRLRTLAYTAARFSGMFRYFMKDYPRHQAGHRDLTARMLSAIQEELRASFEDVRFVVIYHPGHQGLAKMDEHLDRHGVEHHSLVDLFEVDDLRYVHHPHDTHLNPRGNRLVGDAIAVYLRRSQAPHSDLR